MNKDDVGCFFTTTGEDVWQLMVFCEHPTATLENIKTGRRTSGAVDSLILQPFVKLIPEKTMEDRPFSIQR